MEKKKLKKLVLTKNVVSSLTPEERIKIKGGTGFETMTGNTCIADTCHGMTCGRICTYVCETLIIEGCDSDYSWNYCSENCTDECFTAPMYFSCNQNCD
jgi:hypothetical protein